jgi:hypothetical protein
MDIKAILTGKDNDNEVDKLFSTIACRKKDLKFLVQDCKAQLSIY